MEAQHNKTADGANQVIFNSEFKCEFGEIIFPLTLVYETWGTLNKNKDNVILIHHALTPSAHVKSSQENPSNGWWEEMLGKGRTLDPDKYFIVCINNLSSPFGSSSPLSINPKTNKPYQIEFPKITITDIAQSQKILLDALGIKKLHTIIGNSIGGMISLELLLLYPKITNRLILVSTAAKAYPANIANRVVQKEIIKLDPAWKNGFYTENPIQGLKTARKLGHFTYKNPSNLNKKFENDTIHHPYELYEVEKYLEYNAEKFALDYDANCYLKTLDALDYFDVYRDKSKLKNLNSIESKVLIVSVDSDILYLPEQQQDLYHLFKLHGCKVEFVNHHSELGHDAFLIEIDTFDEMFRKFIY